MLLLASYDIVFQEVPGEVTLALNISGCPNGCSGCHSPHLQQLLGEPLDDGLLLFLLGTYGDSVTCVCFMGGDARVMEVERLARTVRSCYPYLKTGWYSGRDELPEGFDVSTMDYIKLGPYVEGLGGLTGEGTNQRFYKVRSGGLEDITNVFLR